MHFLLEKDAHIMIPTAANAPPGLNAHPVLKALVLLIPDLNETFKCNQ